MALTAEGAIETVAQLTGMWTALIEDQGRKIFVRDGVIHLWADSPFGFYNTLTIADRDIDAADLEKRLKAVADFMRGSTESGYLYLSEELLDEDALTMLEDIAGRNGLIESMDVTGMAGDVLPLDNPDHADLRFERVTTQAHLDAYAGLNARAYGMSEDAVREAFRGSRLWTTDIHAYLGYAGDRPVCCAGTYPVGNCLFVVLVATEPSEQRRGYGETVTRKALYEGGRATGLKRAALQASPKGRSVYERIGLGATSRIRLYTLARPSVD